MTKRNSSKILAFVFLALTVLVGSCDRLDTPVTESASNDINFEFIPSSTSSVTFSNTITPDMSSMANLFDYDYFYNGAGVGVADLDNDGLQDIFFCGNQASNTLYRNLGDFKFEDVSANAGINQGKNWSNGVTFADINKDGFLDIYVSQGGPNQDSQRANLLFINNGDLTFSERAAAFGLDDTGITTQSAFADFDGDGDMDCIVMNEAELYGYDLIPFYEKVNYNQQTKYFNTSHIYENVEGKFVDRTPGSALDQPSFGLGLVVTDLNDDKRPDIYIANDYFIPDVMLINRGDFTFEDQIKGRTNQVSFFGMGMDVADINNDGHEDIFVLDMAAKDHYRAKTLMASMNTSFFDLLTNQIGFAHQYMYNSLQLNDGNGSYNNIAQLAGVSSTDWSWTGLLEDFNNDGYRDLYITNGYRKYALDNDFKRKIDAAKEKYKGNIPLDVKKDLYNQIPEEKLANVLYQNNTDLTFTDITNQANLSAQSFSNGAATGDFDNDGDLDLVVNNIDQEAFILKNTARNSNWLQVQPDHANADALPKVTINYGSSTQVHTIRRTRGYMSAAQPVAHFGLGSAEVVDHVSIEWQDGTLDQYQNVTTNQLLQVSKGSSPVQPKSNIPQQLFVKTSLGKHKLSYKHIEDDYDDFAKEILLPHKQSTDGPAIKVLDINSDGLDDLFVGGALGAQSKIFVQESRGKFNRNLYTSSVSSYEDTDAELIKVASKMQLLVTSGGNSSADASSYRNRITALAKELSSETFIEQEGVVSSKITKIDFDADGDEDVVIGNRIMPQQYPLHAGSHLYENTPNGLINVTKIKAPDLAQIGIINDLAATDIDNDGDQDLVAVGDWSGINVLINDNGTFTLSNKSISDLVGWWNKIQVTDIDNDGDQDLVVGNLGLNSKYKASKEKPLKIYAEDFDQNGSLDIVLSKKYKDEYVPFRGKECSSQQMPFVSEKFPTYDLFAKASITDVYGDLDGTYNRAATEFRSMVLVNDGSGEFAPAPLPNLAQVLPIKDMVSIDLNHDGFEDIVAVGNIYNTEVETPRMDFNSAIVLFNDKKGNYIPKPANSLGITIKGNAKSIEKLKIEGRTYIVIGVNDGLLNLFEVKT